MHRPRDRSFLWKMRRRIERRLRALWLQRLGSSAPATIELADVKARLEHYLRAIYGRSVRIEAVGGARGAARGRGRAAGALGGRRRSTAAMISESDAHVIRLPASLPPSGDRTPAFEQYRCLAIEHAERIVRATAHHAAELGSELERDLFELAEAVSIDHAIAVNQPGLSTAIASGRARAMRARIARSGASEVEHRVELLAQSAFAHRVGSSDAPVPAAPDAEGSAAWARRIGAEIAGSASDRTLSAYRRIAPLGLWGTTIVGGAGAVRRSAAAGPPLAAPEPGEAPRSRSTRRLPSIGTPDMVESREDPGGEGGEQPSASPSASRPMPDAPPTDDPAGVEMEQQSVEGPTGTRGAQRETRGSRRGADIPSGVVHRYPEWDAYAKEYHVEESVVRVTLPQLRPEQGRDILGPRHAMLVRQVRDRFAQLRAQRQRLLRQPNGDEIDLDAWVTASADLAAGHNPDDRLYATVRVTRRALAILLLIDASASTRVQVDAEHRVIDVERVAALLAAEAFDALGDAYAILAFASDGRADVRITEIKRFSESNGALTEQRLAALRPFNATRLGAALRHATAELALRPESHRLLLVLSDGKPNDRDGYVDEDYAVEDSRRAVTEARAAGVTPYCITIDPEEPQEYMEHIFGENGFRALAETGHLPEVLLRAVQGLVRR